MFKTSSVQRWLTRAHTHARATDVRIHACVYVYGHIGIKIQTHMRTRDKEIFEGSHFVLIDDE